MLAPPTQSLKIYKLFDEAHLPIYGTKWSACFDLSASIREQDEVTIMGASNLPTKRKLTDGFIPLYAGERCLVPTGLIFDLDQNQSLRIHPRSGLAWKQGISIANCEGVVDADYVEQSYVMLVNVSRNPLEIRDGMRVAQGEIINTPNRPDMYVIQSKPVQKTDRNGGFGSTGKSHDELGGYIDDKGIYRYPEFL